MKKLEFEIAGIPALLVGEPSERLYLYVHGKMGCKEEALDFAERACPAGYQVLAIDLPEHGQRKGRAEKLLPWVAVPELQAVYRYAAARWLEVLLRATSIGAWLSMQALQRMPLEKALLVSPVVDMEDLITHMMQWADVTGAQLEAKGEIPTTFGETLSWPYLERTEEQALAIARLQSKQALQANWPDFELLARKEDVSVEESTLHYRVVYTIVANICK